MRVAIPNLVPLKLVRQSIVCWQSGEIGAAAIAQVCASVNVLSLPITTNVACPVMGL